MMTKWQRDICGRLYVITNWLGGAPDMTAISNQKLRDCKIAHGWVSVVIAGICSDSPENPEREYDKENTEEYLAKLEALKEKAYPDRNGNY